jgi:hypothetical protein
MTTETEREALSFHDALQIAEARFQDHAFWNRLDGTPWENDAPVIAALLMVEAAGYRRAAPVAEGEIAGLCDELRIRADAAEQDRNALNKCLRRAAARLAALAQRVAELDGKKPADTDNVVQLLCAKMTKLANEFDGSPFQKEMQVLIDAVSAQAQRVAEVEAARKANADEINLVLIEGGVSRDDAPYLAVKIADTFDPTIKLACGHPHSLLIRSVESDYSFCELCDTRNQRDDAVTMEAALQIKLTAAQRENERLRGIPDALETLVVFFEAHATGPGERTYTVAEIAQTVRDWIADAQRIAALSPAQKTEGE